LDVSALAVWVMPEAPVVPVAPAVAFMPVSVEVAGVVALMPVLLVDMLPALASGAGVVALVVAGAVAALASGVVDEDGAEVV
jgi:hypothetical protein